MIGGKIPLILVLSAFPIQLIDVLQYTGVTLWFMLF